MDVREYIEANASGFFAALKEWLAIPSISGDPGHRRRRAALRGMARSATCARPGSRSWRSGRPAPPTRRACPRCSPSGPPPTRPRRPSSSTATTTCSRSSRSRSGRPRRSRRSSGTAQLIGRGASDDKGQILFHTLGLRAGLAASGDDRAARHDQDADRGRGGVRLAALRATLLRDRAGPARLRRRRDQRHHHVGRRRAVDVHRHARPHRGRGLAVRPVERPALRLVRRRGAQPAARDGGAARRPARRAQPRHAQGLLRRRRRAHRRGARAVRAAALRRGGVARRRRAAAARRSARRASPPSSASGRARPPRSTACGAATPAPAARRSCPREAHAKVSFRLVAGQDPRRGPGGVRGLRRRAHPARHRGRGTLPRAPACGRASRRSTHRGCCAARRAMERAFGREVLFTREGGSGPEADLADILGRAAGVRRRRPGRGPHPRAQREGRDAAAAQGRRGRGVPLGRARRPA